MKRIIVVVATIIYLLLFSVVTFAAYPTTTEHHKLYPYTSVMASPYSCDPTGAIDIAAAIEQLKANQSNVGTIYFPHGTFKLATNLTIPETMAVVIEAGARLSIATGVTLTWNCGLPEGASKNFFVLNGTAAVSFNSSIKKFDLALFSPHKDGITSDTAILQSAINSISAGTVFVDAGSYALATTVKLKTGVTIEGVGSTTIFVPTGSVEAFGADANIVHAALYPLVKCCKIDSSGNANNINVFSFNYYLKNAIFDSIEMVGNPSAAQTAFYSNHTRPDTSANQVYRNLWRGVSFTDFRSFGHDGTNFTGGAVYLSGLSGRRANENRFEHCVWNGYRIALNVGGINNIIYTPTFNAPVNPILSTNPAGANGTDFPLYASVGNGNYVYGGYLESFDGKVFSIGTGNANSSPDCTWQHFGVIGVNVSNQALDFSSDRIYTATYVNGTQFTVVDDKTAIFTANTEVAVYQGTDGMKTTTVVSSSYGAGVTTVVLTDSILTGNLTTAYYIADREVWLSDGIRAMSDVKFGRNSIRIRQITYGSVSVTPGSIAAGAIVQTTSSVPYTFSSGFVVPMVKTLSTGIIIRDIYIISGTLYIRFYNTTAAPINPGTVEVFYLYLYGVS